MRHATVATTIRTMMACLLLVWLWTSGCQSISPLKALSWPWSETEMEPVVPDRMLVVWSDTVLHQPGEAGMRGFGGRLFFYQGDKKDPVEVDGGLAVYVFDADKVDPHSPAPERKFVFDVDHFGSHMSQSDLGRSYSVWLPWDEVGGPSRRLSIVARFEGRHGGVVISQPTLKLLPGARHTMSVTSATTAGAVQSPEDQPAADSRIRTVDYQAPVSPVSPDEATGISSRKPTATRLTPHTIDLPPSFYQRNLRATASEEPATLVAERTRQGLSPEPGDLEPRDLEPRAQIPNGANGPNGTASENDVSDPAPRTLRHYPSRSPSAPTLKNRTLRREPFRAGWIESLPQTPRR